MPRNANFQAESQVDERLTANFPLKFPRILEIMAKIQGAGYQ